MSLDKISSQLVGNKNSLPPVESWNPPYCGEINIQIKANGDWFYDGGIFQRLSLVKLFASVLIKERNRDVTEYFLVTPVEKVKIQVDEAPFVLTQWYWLDKEQTIMQVSTNLDDEFILNAEHPLMVTESGDLYVTVRRNLLAKVHRNVYYQWADIAQEIVTENGTELLFSSAGCQFSLGSF